MLQITIPSVELYDEKNNEFRNTREQVLVLEHSLVSLSKWESKWKKPFLSTKDKTREESIDYIKCMTITQNVDPDIYLCINASVMDQISKYISDPMTATTFREDDERRISREIITSEIIYHWMIMFDVPFECQKWHLNRLLTLIHVCNNKHPANKPKNKRRSNELLRSNYALNEARKAEWGTKG